MTTYPAGTLAWPAPLPGISRRAALRLSSQLAAGGLLMLTGGCGPVGRTVATPPVSLTIAPGDLLTRVPDLLARYHGAHPAVSFALGMSPAAGAGDYVMRTAGGGFQGVPFSAAGLRPGRRLASV